jgi:hypothetical protein
LNLGGPGAFGRLARHRISFMKNVSDIRAIRAAIWSQGVCFPAQAPVFLNLQRADIQWRIAVLYFVQRWSSGKIAERYGVTRKRVAQILRQWTARAMARGYLDRIPSLSECVTEPRP